MRNTPGGRTAASLIGLTLFLSAGAARAQPQPPDIVVIMADDLDARSFQTALADGCTVDGRPCLPNLRRFLVTPGTTFSESFASLPLCCPSRSTYLTGQYPHNHQVLRNSGPSGGFVQFYQQNAGSSLPVWMSARYRTAHIGKYLNGYVFGQLKPEGWDEWHGLVDGSTYCMYGFTISHNGQPQTYPATPENYQTDVLARLADTLIRQHDAGGDARPLFLSIAPLAPHLESQCNPAGVRPAPRHAGTVALPLPMDGCSFDEDNMNDKPAWMRALPHVDPSALRVLYDQRLASLRALDDLVGTVVAALQQTGRLERTALLFTSDNGYLLGQHRWKSKVLVYEESIRVPLVLRVPGRTTPSVVNAIALNNDLAPTILALAGLAPDPGHVMDGRSLLPLLDGTAPQWRRRFLLEYPVLPPGAAAPGAELDLLGEGLTVADLPPYVAVRTGATGDLLDHLVYSQTLDAAGAVTDTELYDLRAGVDGFADPRQCTSLHASTAPLRVFQRQQLAQQLAALKTCGQGTCQQLEE
jgi:N-acetylglucosamine-6-sulfatase